MYHKRNTKLSQSEKAKGFLHVLQTQTQFTARVIGAKCCIALIAQGLPSGRNSRLQRLITSGVLYQHRTYCLLYTRQYVVPMWSPNKHSRCCRSCRSHEWQNSSAHIINKCPQDKTKVSDPCSQIQTRTSAPCPPSD